MKSEDGGWELSVLPRGEGSLSLFLCRIAFANASKEFFTVSFAGARAGHLEEELEEKRRALLGKHLA